MPRRAPFGTFFRDRFFIDFWSQLRPLGTQKLFILYWFSTSFLKTRSSKLVSIFDPNLERRCFEKTMFFLRKNNDFEGSGGRSWDQKSIKNRSKNEVILGRYLGIDFSWILVDLGGQVGAKLGSKIDKKSIQKGIEKQMPKRRRQNRQKSASWGVLGRLKRHLGAFDRATAAVRRIRVGQSKGQIRPFLSWNLDHATGSPAHGRGRRIANACGDHRRPPIF